MVAAELDALLPGAILRGTRKAGARSGLLWFDFAGPVERLAELRVAEDLFLAVSHLRGLPATLDALRQLERAARDAPLNSPVLSRTGTPRRRASGGRTFRVVARQIGAAPYRRSDLVAAVSRGIIARADGPWRLVPEGGQEFWVTAWPGEALLALRLTDRFARHRDYKLAHLPASLRPSAAATLVRLTRPAAEDVFLDPMCGAGTLLIERAEAGRYRLLLGGDRDPQAVDATRANIGRRYQPIEIRAWDASDLPLDAGSVTALATNLPFGTQIGTRETNRRLYPAFLREASRVLRAGARMVTLTGDVATLDESLRRRNDFRSGARYPVRVLGHPARIDVLVRR